MRKHLTRCAALAAVLMSLVIPTAAEAHFITYADARSRWYYVFNDHCGNGTLWVCRDRNVDGDGSNGIAAIRTGEHSYYMTYTFLEEYVPTGNQRYCQVSGKLTHTTVAYYDEACWG